MADWSKDGLFNAPYGRARQGGHPRGDRRPHNFTPEERKSVKLFYLRGGFIFKNLDFKNKVLMRLLQWKLALKKNKTPDEVGLLDAHAHPIDFVKKEYIRGLVAYIKDKT